MKQKNVIILVWEGDGIVSCMWNKLVFYIIKEILITIILMALGLRGLKFFNLF